MRTFPCIVASALLFFSAQQEAAAIVQNQAPPDLTGATRVQLWATNYYLLEVNPSTGSNAVPLRNRANAVIGPALSPGDWCAAAMEGSVRVSGLVFNYAGVANPRQTDCRHDPSERVRWARSPHPYGIGSNNNPLIPFRTLACDLGTVRDSRPWLNGGYARFGQRIYIPASRGVRLPDGTVHDGMFACGDTGGLIIGNHIDVFIGPVRGGEAGARRVNPFPFIRSSSSHQFEAYVLPN